MQRPEDYHNLVWNRDGQSAGWDHSAWDDVEVIDAGPDKVHFRVTVHALPGRRRCDRQLPVAVYRDVARRVGRRVNRVTLGPGAR